MKTKPFELEEKELEAAIKHNADLIHVWVTDPAEVEKKARRILELNKLRQPLS